MTLWKRQCCPQRLTPTDVSAEAATGKVMLHSNLDQYGRPVAIVRAALHKKGTPCLPCFSLQTFLLYQVEIWNCVKG